MLAVSKGLPLTLTVCRRAGIVVVSARQLKTIEKPKLKLTTKSPIEFGQARYKLIVVQQPIVIPYDSLAPNLLLFACGCCYF